MMKCFVPNRDRLRSGFSIEGQATHDPGARFERRSAGWRAHWTWRTDLGFTSQRRVAFYGQGRGDPFFPLFVSALFLSFPVVLLVVTIAADSTAQSEADTSTKPEALPGRLNADP